MKVMQAGWALRQNPSNFVKHVAADIRPQGCAAVFAVQADYDIVVTNAGNARHLLGSMDAVDAGHAHAHRADQGHGRRHGRGYGRIVNITSSGEGADRHPRLSNGGAGFTGFVAGLRAAARCPGRDDQHLLPGVFDTDRSQHRCGRGAEDRPEVEAIQEARKVGSFPRAASARLRSSAPSAPSLRSQAAWRRARTCWRTAARTQAHGRGDARGAVVRCGTGRAAQSNSPPHALSPGAARRITLVSVTGLADAGAARAGSASTTARLPRAAVQPGAAMDLAPGIEHLPIAPLNYHEYGWFMLFAPGAVPTTCAVVQEDGCA